MRDKVKEKQFEVVNELVNEISKHQISFDYYINASNSGGVVTYITHFLAQNFRQSSSELFNRSRFIVEADPSGQFYSFLRLRGNPYMPEEIFILLDKFWIKPLSKVELADIQTNSVVLCDMRKSGSENREYYLVEEFQTFEQFYDFIKELLMAVNKWLEIHEAGEIRFRENYKLK